MDRHAEKAIDKLKRDITSLQEKEAVFLGKPSSRAILKLSNLLDTEVGPFRTVATAQRRLTLCEVILQLVEEGRLTEALKPLEKLLCYTNQDQKDEQHVVENCISRVKRWIEEPPKVLANQ